MKSRQFCSVCKEWLDMEVVPTGEGDDDGVIWFRCPQCQGFLPKLSGKDSEPAPIVEDASPADPALPDEAPDSSDSSTGDNEWDSPADMMAARTKSEAPPALNESLAPGVDYVEELPGGAGVEEVDADLPEPETAGTEDGDSVPEEPLAEYAAMLAAIDPATSVPYRPWDEYEVGQGIHHLAWDDVGVVVAKEKLPGQRQVIKCYFSDAGVVRLIENASP